MAFGENPISDEEGEDLMDGAAQQMHWWYNNKAEAVKYAMEMLLPNDHVIGDGSEVRYSAQVYQKSNLLISTIEVWYKWQPYKSIDFNQFRRDVTDWLTLNKVE